MAVNTDQFKRVLADHERELAAVRARQALEINQAKARHEDDIRDFQIMINHHEAMYTNFSTILTRALTPIRAGGYAFANSGTLSRICGNMTEGSFLHTNCDGFLRRMNNEGLLRCVTKSNTCKSGKTIKRHYYYIDGVTGDDVENLEETRLRALLI
jgi:hypothetical protein